MLTGTNNFAQILDDMIDDGLILSTEKTTYQGLYDGYKLKFTILNNPITLETTTDDSCGICFYSEENGGATCAGASYNGSAVVSWARWVESSIFIASAKTAPYSEPTGTTMDSTWFLMDPTGDVDLTISGTNWSTYRFQPVKGQTGF